MYEEDLGDRVHIHAVSERLAAFDDDRARGVGTGVLGGEKAGGAG